MADTAVFSVLCSQAKQQGNFKSSFFYIFENLHFERLFRFSDLNCRLRVNDGPEHRRKSSSYKISTLMWIRQQIDQIECI